MAVELDTDGNKAIDISLGGTNAKTAGEALFNLGGQPYDADLDILSSGSFSQKRALIEAFAKPVLGVDALRTTMADFDGDCRYLAYHTASGDGGHGTFYWDAASAEEDDGQDTIAVTGVSTGRWKRNIDPITDELLTHINFTTAQALSDAKFYADNQFVTQVLHQAAVDNLQGQLDGQVIAWFYDYAPTLNNAPASLWTTEALRDQHANDTFTHLTTGQSWRWVYDAGVWKWLEIADTAATAALAMAAQAKDTADHKRRVFVAQPTVPYDVGDLWADGTTLLRCVTPKTSTGSYAAGDWMAVADKTDYTNTETFPAVLTPDVMKRTGSTFEKVGGVAGWNAQAYSLQGYTGGCRLAFKAGVTVTTLNFMAGINTDPATDASYTSVDYQFHMLSNVTVDIYEGSTLRSIGSPPFTTDTLFEIIYDGSEIRYLMDGVTKRTVTGLDAGLTFYMDLSFSRVGSKVTHVQWGPYAPPLSVVKALALAAETEAKAFADGIVTAEEQRAIADAQAKANAAQAAAESNAKSYADTTFVTQVLHQTDLSNLQSQVDGQVSAWFYSYAPTTANAPASSWTTVALKEQHANDTFTRLDTGQSWRWVNTAGVWGWTEIVNTATVTALAAAAQAQDTADNKRRVFVATPTVPYDIGDLWTTGSTISRCVTAKTTAGSYAAGDWVAVADATNYDDYRVSNVKTENSVTTIARPVGGTYYNNGDSVTGAIKITLPQSWSNTMMKFGVDIRQLSTTKSFTLQLGGYNYITGSTWLNSFAQLTGSTASNNRVRFGHDGTKCCILIGDVTSVWNYPSVVVKDFQASYANYIRDKWETGWVISIVTDISGITTTADISDTLIDAKSILGQGALATQNTADYGTQVTGTKPPANADSTTTVIGAGLITTGYIGNKAKTDPLLTLGINFDTAEILVGAAAGLKVKSGGGILVEGGGGITINSGGGITVYSGGGITVKDGGEVYIEAGGDLVFTADDIRLSRIRFYKYAGDTDPTLITHDSMGGLSLGTSGSQLSLFRTGTVTLSGSDIIITGKTTRGVPIYAPVRTTDPTAAEVPANHYIIYRIGTSTLKIAMNIDASMMIRTL